VRAAALLLLAAACSQEPSTTATDRSAYQDALAGDVSACSRIRAPVLAAECTTFLAAAQAASDHTVALATCATVQLPMWRDECGFLVCDTAEVTVAQARTCCVDAGRYQNRCTGHAVSRSVYRTLATFSPGEEAAAWQAARSVSIDALGPPGADRAADLFVRFLVDRSNGATLTAADCGTAPEALCADAYAELVVDVAKEHNHDPARFVRSACARTVTVERATGLGLPGWEPAVDPAVQQAFQKMCAR